MKKASAVSKVIDIISYRHLDTRVNNPEVGMVTPFTDPDVGKARWKYDPHIDPSLQFDSQRTWTENLIDDALASNDPEQMKQALEALKKAQSPYLNWAGKAEHTSFAVDTVSLHVHERVDPASILAAVRKRMGKEEKSKGKVKALQPGLFDAPFENLPLRDALDFYKHEKGWSNRLIAGDSLLVMNSLLQKESMAGKVQMIYFDPPYGITYGSNFQPFVNKKDVKDVDRDLNQEPEMLKAFRDTWELGTHSYLTYIRDRLLLAKDLLDETGSIFLQISDENLHHIRELMDDVFGAQNHISTITFRKKTMPFGAKYLEQMADFIVWYGKDKKKTKYNSLYKKVSVQGEFHHCWYEMSDGEMVKMSKELVDNHNLLPENVRVLRLKSLEPSGVMDSGKFIFKFQGNNFNHPKNGFSTTWDGMETLVKANRIYPEGNRLTFKIYADESSYSKITSPWNDTVGADDKKYVVQTNTEVVKRCILMSTMPGDLVLDLTCGSGTTAYVAEKWGRRWITCDTSRLAITLAKQRLNRPEYFGDSLS